jgi:hypothetical protein
MQSKINEHKQHKGARKGEWRLRADECPKRAQLAP